MVLQTIPPFDYREEKIVLWKNLNRYIKRQLSMKADLIFDCAAILQKSEGEPHIAKYGGHPNEIGCERWGAEFSAALRKIL